MQSFCFMQQKPATDEDDLIEQFNDLISSIKMKTGLSEEGISKRMKYNEGYIAQTKSRGKPNAKLIDNLKREFKNELQNATHVAQEPEPMYKGRKSIDELIASNRILAEANKTLAEAHYVISKNNEDLIQLAKAAFTNLLPQGRDPLSLVDPGTNVAGTEGFVHASGKKGNAERT